jgi:23S rRNA (cytosine1962-C5)-methyltransferase
MAAVILKKQRDKSVKNHHPWIFSGGIERIEGAPQAGDIVDVLSNGVVLGKGFYNPKNSIAVRMISFASPEINQEYWRNALSAAISRRAAYGAVSSAYRLVHGEADMLPGLTVDKYGEYLCIQISIIGMDRLRETIVGLLQELLKPKGIYERSDIPSRKVDGLPMINQVLFGEVPERIEIIENELVFDVDVRNGQKTGFFLDQRENRLELRPLVKGLRVLNCFGYSGGFAVSAAKGGATEVETVDISEDATRMALAHFARNGFVGNKYRAITADVFEYLREVTPGSYDVIILDPPAFTKNKDSVMAAARGYKEINRQAARVLSSGGILVTCSCSQHIDRMLFQKIVHDGVIDAGKDVQILAIRGQGPDHPINISHPEGEYLKCLICRVL